MSKNPVQLLCVIFYCFLLPMLPHCEHEVAQITRNHKVSQSQERMSQAVKPILFLGQFRRLSKLCGYIKSHPAITATYICAKSPWFYIWSCFLSFCPCAATFFHCNVFNCWASQLTAVPFSPGGPSFPGWPCERHRRLLVCNIFLTLSATFAQ